MSSIERIPPGDVVVRISLDACLRATPRRPLPADMAAWAQGLPVPTRFVKLGLQQALREAVSPLWSAWLARFRQGLRIEQEADACVVVHCDTVRYRILPGGEVSAEMPRPGGGYEPISVELGTPFPSWTWARVIALREPEAVTPLMEDIRVRRLAGLENRDAHAGDLEAKALAWLADVIERLARRCVDGLQMRRQLLAALRPDPILLDAARRARPRALRNTDVVSEWWNLCITHREALLEMRRLAPALLPLYGELIHQGKIQPGRLDWTGLRQVVGAEGLLPAKWRFLLRDRAAPIWQMHREWLIGSLENLCAFLVDWARLHEGLHDGVRLPRALWEPLARTSVEPLWRYALPPIAWPVSPRATGQAIERYRRAASRGEGVNFVENEWGRVVRWAANYAGVNKTTLVRSWGTARREAANDERRMKAWSQGRCWPVAIPEIQDGALHAVALTNGLELAEEAIAMRHCADRYIKRCENGELLIFSTREIGTKKRRVSVAIELGSHAAWVAEVARSLNRKPDEEERAFAEKIAEAVSEQIKAHALLRAEFKVSIPPVGPGVLFMERNDSDVYAFIESTETGWKGYKYQPCGTVKPISGNEAVETLNPGSWSPMTREDFVGAVEVLMTLRSGYKAGTDGSKRLTSAEVASPR